MINETQKTLLHWYHRTLSDQSTSNVPFQVNPGNIPNSLETRLLQGVPYVLGRTFESLGPIMLTFWIFLIKYGKKHTFQWLIWCYLLSRSCTFIKNTGENVQYYFATLLYNLVSKTKIVFQNPKKSQNDQKWDLNWIIGHSVEFWVLKS